MKSHYIDLIEQTFDFPQEEFKLNDGKLIFHDINLSELIEKYGTPLKFRYLPKISTNIQQAKKWFKDALTANNYKGKYYYCYCTKSSHFQPVLEEVLKNDTHLETSSAFDIDIVKNLTKNKLFSKNQYVICNGFKRDQYIVNIASLINDGYSNCIPVIDNYEELSLLQKETDKPFKIGIRIASEEEPKFEFYTSRLGIGYKKIMPIIGTN